MTDPVAVGSLTLLGSMFGIVIGATVAGLLCYVIEKRMDRSDAH